MVAIWEGVIRTPLKQDSCETKRFLLELPYFGKGGKALQFGLLSMTSLKFTLAKQKKEELEIAISFLYPRRTKYVEEYIVFVFPSVCLSLDVSVRPSIQVLTFYVKILHEVF